MISRPVALLSLLTVVNLLNFIDRQILYAIFPAVQSELGLADSQLGLAASAFIVVYMLVTPIAGYLGDRVRRLPVIGASVIVWSVASLASGSARTFYGLLAARSLVGVGEACYAPLSSSVLSDAFRKERHGTALSVFNLAVPVGSALGYVLGSAIAAAYGWRAAFYLVGAPGIAIGALLFLSREPARGAMDPTGDSVSSTSLRELFANPVYRETTAAMAALTFVLGALAAWMPTFLVRLHGLTIARAGITFGLVTAATGLAGTALGGWLGDRAVARDPAGHLHVSGVGLLLAVPATAVAIAANDPAIFWTATALAEVLVFLNVGPLNAVIVGVASSRIRASAVAANVLAIHLCGDALSPSVVGFLSDLAGLRVALAVMPPLLLVAALLCFRAGRSLRAAKH
jgi:MFS family permease